MVVAAPVEKRRATATHSHQYDLTDQQAVGRMHMTSCQPTDKACKRVDKDRQSLRTRFPGAMRKPIDATQTCAAGKDIGEAAMIRCKDVDTEPTRLGDCVVAAVACANPDGQGWRGI